MPGKVAQLDWNLNLYNQGQYQCFSMSDKRHRVADLNFQF